MIRKYDRILAMLLIWIAILLVMVILLDRFLTPHINSANIWYWPGNIVIGTNAESANQTVQSINEISNTIYNSLDTFTRNEMWTYAPLMLFSVVTVLISALLCTWFIWRSVRLPDTSDLNDHASAAKSKNRLPLPRRPVLQQVPDLVEEDARLAHEPPRRQRQNGSE